MPDAVTVAALSSSTSVSGPSQSAGINTGLARPAVQFLKRLSNDMVTRDDVRSMKEVLEPLFPKDADKKPDLSPEGREAAADKLINSLNELDRNGDISEEAQNIIKQIFVDERLGSVDAISNKFLQDEVKVSLWDTFKGTPPPVEKLVNDRFPKDEKTGEIVFNKDTREDAAGKLIEDINKLRKNEPLSEEEADTINKIFKDESLTSPDAIAAQLRSEKSLKDEWYLFAPDRSDFAMSMNAAQLENLRMFLNKFAAPLGDIMANLIELAIGDDHKYEPKELEARNSFAEGYNVVMNGMAGNFAKFRGEEIPKDGSQLNNWDGPAVEGWLPEFFGEGLVDASGEPIELFIKHDDVDGYVQNFDTMIVDRWVEEGHASFANDAAREAFVNHCAQLIMGGDLSAVVDQDNDGQMEGFVPTLEERGVLEFETPEAREKFLEELKQIKTDHNYVTAKDENGDTLEHREAEIAQQVIDLANKMDGVELKLTDSDSSESHYSTAETEIIKVAQHYVKVNGSEDFVDRLAEYAGDRSDITLNFEANNSIRLQQGPSAADGAPPSIKVSHWDPEPTKGGEAPSISHGESKSTMMIGDKPATEAFAHHASGAGAELRPSEPGAAVENQVENEQQIAWSQSTKVDDTMSPV